MAAELSARHIKAFAEREIMFPLKIEHNVELCRSFDHKKEFDKNVIDKGCGKFCRTPFCLVENVNCHILCAE